MSNHFINRELSGKEIAELVKTVNSPGWAIFEEIQAFLQGSALAVAMDVTRDTPMRDSNCGVWKSAGNILNFKAEVEKLSQN